MINIILGQIRCLSRYNITKAVVWAMRIEIERAGERIKHYYNVDIHNIDGLIIVDREFLKTPKTIDRDRIFAKKNCWFLTSYDFKNFFV